MKPSIDYPLKSLIIKININIEFFITKEKFCTANIRYKRTKESKIYAIDSKAILVPLY